MFRDFTNFALSPLRLPIRNFVPLRLALAVFSGTFHDIDLLNFFNAIIGATKSERADLGALMESDTSFSLAVDTHWYG
ncbi:hypothetical protein M5K25_013202 [Dendrobium thyrsiflorum]|uniref:Uncharacterized protein n=1 Tax=Dendrobium thyrsiflorum TaxID=117978 RepID=A0ABD0USX5_DENTH